MILPGWDSIEGAGWWSSFYFWAGIVSLVLLCGTEVLSHVYGLRRDALVDTAKTRMAEESAEKDRLAADATEQLRKQLEEAEQRTADAMARATRLEKRVSPRTISKEQRETLVSELSRFRGQAVTFMSLVGDADGDSFKRQLASTLKDAGWKFDESSLDSQSIMSRNLVGLQIMMNEGEVKAGRVLLSAQTLVVLLQKLGFTDKPILFTNPGTPIGMIFIAVGTKP